MTDVNPSLSDAELAHYKTHGYVVRAQAFDPPEVEVLQTAAELTAKHYRNLADQGKAYVLDGKRFVDVDSTTVQFEHPSAAPTPHPQILNLRVIEPAHLVQPSIDHLVDDSRLVCPMQQILQAAQLSLWTSKMNLKRPQQGSGFGWHQDSPYWVHDCDWVDQLPNVMLTLDAQHRENGCFSLIRGSHHQGMLPGTNDGSQLGGFFTDPTRFDLADQVWFEVPAGSLIFFDPHTIHGSGPNPSTTARRALILTYQPGHHPMLKNGKLRAVRTG